MSCPSSYASPQDARCRVSVLSNLPSRLASEAAVTATRTEMIICEDCFVLSRGNSICIVSHITAAFLKLLSDKTVEVLTEE